MTIGFLGTSLTKALLPRLLSLARRPALEDPGGSKFLPFKNDGGHFLGTFNATEMFWYPSLDLDTILSRSSTDNSFNLTAWFLL